MTRCPIVAVLLGVALLAQSLGADEHPSGSPVGASGPIISEFMAANEAGLRDRYGDHPDWIEIYNPTDQAIDLAGWHLTNDRKSPRLWTFPAGVRISAGRYVVVFASKRNSSEGGELHASFKLKASGGYLALTRPDGSVAHDFGGGYPPQRADISFGIPRAADGEPVAPTYLAKPTPGKMNRPAVRLGPAIQDVRHTPAQPRPGDAVTVIVRAGRGAALVLHYRVMFGDEVEAPMFDDGAHGDAAAGDGVYAASIPAGKAETGEMIRWYVTAADGGGGHTSRFPAFVATDAPQYLGTVIADPDAPRRSVPVFRWFAPEAQRAQSDEAGRVSVYFLGRFYDNVRVRRRGAATTRGYRFHANPKHQFVWREGERPVGKINVNYRSSLDETLLRPTLAFETYRDAGSFYCATFPVRLEHNGRLEGLAYFVEEPGPDYLRRQGLAGNGPLYKATYLHPQMNDLKAYKKRTRRWEDQSDLRAFFDGIHQRPGPARDRFILQNLDLPSFINYMAATTIINDSDHIQKNFLLYKDIDGDGRWRVLPWDKDLTFGKHWKTPDYGADISQLHPLL
ncbi:MAG TPA: CotH kinase family protein, partial [Tepidisphaeraceae bacterium]